MTEYIVTAIALLVTIWLISRIPCCKGKRGTLDVSKLLDTGDKPVRKRKQRIGNTVFHIKSVFTGQRELEEAINNIVMRKMESGHRPKEKNTK